jgi:polar amino acid transport system substrate-binding protein
MAYKPRSQSFSPVLIFVLFLLLVLPGRGFCQNTRIIVVTEHWPPFRINDENSPTGFRGIDIDITHKLSDALGIPIEIQRHPWARSLEQMRSGQADMITGIAHTPERETFMYYIPVSYYAVRPVFYAQKGKGHLIRSYQDLHGPSVGYSLNSAYFKLFDSDSQIKKVGLSTEIQLLQVLALGRMDVTIGTEPNISYDISRLGYRNILEPTDYQPPDKTDLFIALSRKSPAMALAQKIEAALVQMIKNGTIDEIINTYR